MEERRGSVLESCLEWCYTRCFGYGQHDFQTNGSRRDRFVSGCEHCCKRTCSCLCCLPCYDFLCDRCVGHSFCYKCLHCSCFYSEDKEDLPDCDTTPGLVRQSSVKSLDKYVSPCVATNFSILDQPTANPSADPNRLPKANSSTQSASSSSKMNVKAVTHQPPRLSLLISKKNPYEQMQSSSTATIPEEHDNSALETDEDFPNGTTVPEEIEVHETEGDTGEEEINTAKVEPENLNTNIFIRDFKQTTVWHVSSIASLVQPTQTMEFHALIF